MNVWTSYTDPDRIRLYEQLCYPGAETRMCFGRKVAANLLSHFPHDLAGRPEPFRIIDLGCGKGSITIEVVKSFLHDEGPRDIELVAVDHDAGMIEAFRERLLENTGVVEEPCGTGGLVWTVAGRTARITLRHCPFAAFMAQRASSEHKFDVVFSLFLLHHIHHWREATQQHAELAAPNGILVISEMLGDHAGWSCRFDKLVDVADLRSNSKRKAYLRFIQRYWDVCHAQMWFYAKPISASHMEPVLENLRFRGLRPRKAALELSFMKTFESDEWLSALGLRNGEPIFSLAPKSHEIDVEAKETLVKQLSSFPPDHYESKNLLKLYFLERSSVAEDIVPEPSAARGLRDAFSRLIKYNSRTTLDQVWKPDLIRLLGHGLLDKAALGFLVHWSLEQNTWTRDVPFVCESEELLRATFLYLQLASMVVKSDTGNRTLTHLLYRHLPSKSIFCVRFGNEPPRVDIEFHDDGKSLRKITIMVPEDIVGSDARRLCEEFMSCSRDAMHEVWSKGKPPFPGAAHRILNNRGLQSQYSDDRPLQDARGRLEQLYDSGTFFERDILSALQKEIEDAFAFLGEHFEDPRWKKPGESDDWLNWFSEVLGASSLLGVSSIRHFPSRDTVRLGQEQQTEQSAGGLILYVMADQEGAFSERTEALLLDLLNLRNRALYIDQHGQHAAAQLLEQARRATAAAIMARNMSHNIGSHPIAYLSKAEKLQDYSIEEIANFLSYLRNRMDYIADVSTDIPRWSSALSLEYIVDEFEKQTLLRKHLTELPNGCGVSCLDNAKKLVLMPHGWMGAQALYSIFENILRNSERHPPPESPSRGVVELRIPSERRDDVLVVDIVDKGTTIEVDENGMSKKVEELKDYLRNPLQELARGDDAGQMSRKYWGLKEMKISAAFLRMRPASVADGYLDPSGTGDFSGTEEVPLVEPIAVRDEDARYLAWRLRLLLPKIALVAYDLFPDIESAGSGLNPLHPHQLKGAQDSDRPFAHHFLVFSPGLLLAISAAPRNPSIWNRLPRRRILVTDNVQLAHTPPGWAHASEAEWNDIVNGPTDAIAGRLRAIWNRELARRAGLSETPALVLATALEKSVFALPSDPSGALHATSGALIADDRSIAGATPAMTGTRGALGLGAFGANRLVVYARHTTAEGFGIDLCSGCWRSPPSCKHLPFWQRAQAFIPSGPAILSAVSQAERDRATKEWLVETGLVWVVVLDERISVGWSERPDELAKLARSGTIIVPFQDPSRITPDELSPDRISQAIKSATQPFAGRPGMLILTIHLRLLTGSTGQEPRDWLSEVTRSLESEWGIPVEIIVHSGRGKPQELFETLKGQKFLEFSNLDNWITLRDFRPLLVDLLLAIRS
jgi:SAM-dependent methyltransferase